jgi:AcrR family transcriptional regulator
MSTSPSERRSAILKAATRLFEHYGHAKTTIADVAREAGIGVGTVYLEFASKEAIVQELSLSTHIGVLDAMRGAILPADDCAKQLAAVLRARTKAFLELRNKGEHACELVHCKTESVQAAHKRFKDQEQELLEGILQRGQTTGVFSACEPKATARLIQRVFASLSPPWIFASSDDAIHLASELCQLLLHGLLVNKDPRAFMNEATPSSRRARSNRTGAARASRRQR